MIFGRDEIRPFHWLKLGLERARMVGRVATPTHVGSGFAVDGVALGDDFAGLPLFFTARHVVPGPSRTLSPELKITFDALTDDPGGGTAQIERLLAASPQHELNYSILLLDRWPGEIPAVNLAPREPRTGERVFVLGYPRGGGLALSLGNTKVVTTTGDRPALTRNADVVMYLAATEGGSSGSAVFNENWELVAVHMGTSLEARANYGARIGAIMADATSKLQDVVLEAELVNQVKARSATQVQPPDYSSVFISYSHTDSTFADRLFNALRMQGVRAWYDKQDIYPGYDIYDEITKGIQEQDKVLLCCSEAAVQSGWLDAEIDRALQKEKELFRAGHDTGRRLPRVKPLIPLDLDGYLLEGRWRSGKAPDLHSRGIADFRNWETQAQFEDAIKRLLRSLLGENGAKLA